MRVFACFYNHSGTARVDEALSHAIDEISRLTQSAVSVIRLGKFVAAVPFAGNGDSDLVARVPGAIGVGSVRLDNRAAVSGSRTSRARNDLGVVVEAFAQNGPGVFGRLLGDFGFVIWNGETGDLLACRDPFGVRGLFRRVDSGYVAYSSHASPLASEAWDLEYIADFLVNADDHAGRTVWASCRAVRPGTLEKYRNGSIESLSLWSAHACRTSSNEDGRDATERFRDLFAEAVALRTAGEDGVWAELSGGLDSSSVIAMAMQHGRLAGTITNVDTLGEGDEREYADCVARYFGVRNESVTDCWPWQGGLAGNPRYLDEPRLFYPFHYRDETFCAAIRTQGGRVLLSGLGSDHYLAGNLSYVADLAAGGRLVEVAKHLLGWAAVRHDSVWRVGRELVIYPLLPVNTKPLLARSWERPPQWLHPGFANRYGIATRMPSVRNKSGPPGRKFAHEVACELDSLPVWINRGPYEHGIEVRYPFLYRPLVEFGLTLPVAMRIDPRIRKRILRDAMAGMLPEKVRSRSTKGRIDARVIWALSKERRCVESLLKDPILADLGCIIPNQLRVAVDAARQGKGANLVNIFATLSLETWLRAWPSRGRVRVGVNRTDHLTEVEALR